MRHHATATWFCRACQKKAYGSESRALDAIETIEEHSERSKKPKRAYECPYNDCWHLTSQEARIA